MKKFFLLVCFWPLFASAQKAPESRFFTVGDTLPDITFQKVINYNDNIMKLSDFKEDFVIIDFWAAWCKSCIENLPKLDSIQVRHADKLKVIMVNCMKRSHDSEKTIRNLAFQNWREVYNKNLSCLVVADRTDTFKQLFTFKMVPHYVWISPKRVILAITSSKEITENNISKMLNGSEIVLPIKDDTHPN